MEIDVGNKQTSARDGAGAARHARTPFLRVLPLLLLGAGLAAAYGLGWHRYVSLAWLVDQRALLLDFVAVRPVKAALLFFVVYVAVVALSVPAASVLTVFGGFLFGWLTGGILVVVAATVGSCLLFWGARTVFGDVLRRRAGPFLVRFSEGFTRNAFHYLLVLRLAPVFPFFVVNIAPAFFPVSLRTFAAATFIGIIPGTFAYSCVGRSFEQVIAQAAVEKRPLIISDFLTPQLTLAFAALALIAALPIIVQFVREKRHMAGNGKND